jgi:hypothetical protein
MTQEEARREIGEMAKDLLSGKLCYIEGSRKLAKLRFVANLENDPDLTPLVAIDSETDAFPFGSVREHWQPNALAKLQPESRRPKRGQTTSGDLLPSGWLPDFQTDPLPRRSLRAMRPRYR